MTDNIIGWDMDADGIVVLTIDDPGAAVNTINDPFKKSIGETLDRLITELDSITGVVVASGKKTFFAGMDLNSLLDIGPDDAERLFTEIEAVKTQLRRLETLGRPVVAAINGAALGGGLELALACHRRIAADVRGAVIGLPEAGLGVLPGGGGVVRTVRMLGIQPALTQVLLQGNKYQPGKALEVGLIDQVVGSCDELIPAAKAWITANPDSGVQPWDRQGYTIPGGAPSALAAILPALPATLRKQLKGANMPAPRAILATAVEGAQVDIDTALTIETRYLVQLITGSVAQNMIQAFFFDMQKVAGGSSRPAGIEKRAIKKVGVLGAGMMGAAIAYVTAKAGMDVVLKDVTEEAALRGKGYSEALEAKAVSCGRSTDEASRAVLDRIHPTADTADLAGVDFVIEAVFEDPALKQKVFADIASVVDSDAVLGSNTSTLPIIDLAWGVDRPEDFIGIHFFSPVDKMQPVEIIRGAKTSDETVARVVDYVLAIKKLPIVVNDSRGFFTSRVFGTFLHEACAMLEEGIDPATIEQAGLQAGYPAPPLQLSDELSLLTMQKVQTEVEAGLAAEGRVPTAAGPTALRVLGMLIGDHGRTGRVGGAGFYDYQDGKRVGLWPELRELFGTRQDLTVPMQDLVDRFVFVQAIETQRVFDDGVMSSDADANIGSIFAIGYPAWTGGVRQLIKGYPGGLEGFVARADELAARYGERYVVPASLRDQTSTRTAAAS